MTCRCSTARGTELPPARRARSASSCPCRPARCRRCGRTTSATSRPTSRRTGLLPHRDGGYIDEDGYLFVMGRTDDVLNVAGHRLSTGSIEAALAGHEAVAECAVIGVHDELKGQVPRALVVLKAGIDGEAEGERIRRELVARVRGEVGAVAALHRVDIVAGLPKTRSGKILRKTMREIADSGNPPCRRRSRTRPCSSDSGPCCAGADSSARLGVRGPGCRLVDAGRVGGEHVARHGIRVGPAPAARRGTRTRRTCRGTARGPAASAATGSCGRARGSPRP